MTTGWQRVWLFEDIRIIRAIKSIGGLDKVSYLGKVLYKVAEN